MIKRNPRATREKIINAAISVFSQGDFNEATMRDIAHESGVSQSNIYQHYPSKENLLFSIIDEEIRRMKNDLAQHLSGIKGTQNKLRKMTWYFLNFREQNRKLAWLEYICLNTKAWSENAEVWKDSIDIAAIFRDLLLEGIRNNEVRQDLNVRVIGHLYFGGLRNAIVFWLLDKQFKSLADKIADSVTDLVWDAIRNRSPNLQCPLLAGAEAAATTMKFAEQAESCLEIATPNT